ncbi:MAG: hypothetical protein N3A63_09995 [Bacteroidetes bacterium]|nr:hypothetical protein [Bacteroidota bacterium]
MERTISLLSFLVLVYSAQYGEDSVTVKLYDAYVTNSMVQWKEYLDSNANKEPTEKLWYQIMSYYYGYIAYCLGVLKDPSEARIYLERAEVLLKQGEQKHYKQSTVFAYHSALIGYRIALHPLSALIIGQKGMYYAERARNADSLDPFAYVQLGNVFYYTPMLFGGSKEKALQFFYRAIQLYEHHKIVKYNWMYLNTLALTGKYAMELGRHEDAWKVLTKALQVEPRYMWVKDELLPQCEDKRKEKE